jgi:hypothetical protein
MSSTRCSASGPIGATGLVKSAAAENSRPRAWLSAVTSLARSPTFPLEHVRIHDVDRRADRVRNDFDRARRQIAARNSSRVAQDVADVRRADDVPRRSRCASSPPRARSDSTPTRRQGGHAKSSAKRACARNGPAAGVCVGDWKDPSPMSTSSRHLRRSALHPRVSCRWRLTCPTAVTFGSSRT